MTSRHIFEQRITHDVYDGLLDAKDVEFQRKVCDFLQKKFHFLYSFDHVLNQEFNSMLIRNVRGVVKDEYDTTMIKCKCL